MLVAGRALQGVFGALLTPASLAIIVAAFHGEERGAAIGTWTAYSGIAAIVGPLAGGWLVDTFDWRWIFAINVPFVPSRLCSRRACRRCRGMGEGRRPDWIGAALCAIGLAGPTFGLIQQPEHGWGGPMVWLPIDRSASRCSPRSSPWERRDDDPMLPLGLFSRGNFAWGNVETLALYGGLGAMFFLLVLFLQQVGGLDAFEAGLGDAADDDRHVRAVAALRRAGRPARAAAVHGHRPARLRGGRDAARRDASTRTRRFADVFPGVIVFALGLSMTVAPLTAAILADADEQNAGIASGVNNAVARVASLLATAGDRRGDRRDARPRRLPHGDGVRDRAAWRSAASIGLLRIRNPRREVHAEDCPGGQLAGQPKPAWCPEEDTHAGSDAAPVGAAVERPVACGGTVAPSLPSAPRSRSAAAPRRICARGDDRPCRAPARGPRARRRPRRGDGLPAADGGPVAAGEQRERQAHGEARRARSPAAMSGQPVDVGGRVAGVGRVVKVVGMRPPRCGGD